MRKFGWGFALVALAACDQSACQPESLGIDGLPQELTMTIDGPVTVAPGGESEPVRVRLVCPRCNIDWSPWVFALNGPTDGTPAQGARFEPAFADWETQLRVLGNAAGPRGEQPRHTVVLRRREPLANQSANQSQAGVDVAITVTGAEFELEPRPAALELTNQLGLIGVVVKREPGFTEAVRVQLVDVLPATPGTPAGAVTVESFDEGPSDRARFLVRDTGEGSGEYVARFTATAGNTRRTTSVAITRGQPGAPTGLSVITSPTSLLLRRGEAKAVDLMVQSADRPVSSLDFSVVGLPNGVSASWLPPVPGVAFSPTVVLRAANDVEISITRPSAVVTSGAVVAEYRFQLTIPGPGRDAGPEEPFDGGLEEDAGVEDSGTPDAGVDAGLPDAGVPQGGPNLVACECLGGLGTRRVCSTQSCLGSIDLEMFCDGVCGDAGVLSLPSCLTDEPMCLQSVVDAGPVDAGPPPGGGANLVSCDCLLGGTRTVCANENCLGTGQLYTYCVDVCGGSSLSTPPVCSTASPACVGSVGDGGLVVFDAGFEGTTLVECGLPDGGSRPLCTNLSCRGVSALTFLALRCQSEFGSSPFAPRSCTSDALQCGGSGAQFYGNAFSCRCSDGRLIGSCESIGECTVAPGILSGRCNEVCAETSSVTLSCEATAPVCPAGTQTFTVDAGLDAGVDAGLPPWDVVQLAAAWTHICARTDAGAVWCWGQNPQLSPAPFNLTRPTQVEGLPPVIDIATTSNATCALTIDGEVLCFGSASRLNINHLPDGGIYGARTIDAGVRFEDLSGGGANMCGLNRDGGLFCWGQNGGGMLGRGFNSTEERLPAPPDGGGPWSFVALGSTHACGLDLQRKAWCWGPQTVLASESAVALDGGRTFSMLSAGAQHTCGIEASTSRALCWGVNSSSQLGVPPATASSAVPVNVDGGRGFVGLTTGGGFTCGVTDGGVAYCWGQNNTGQLGIGTATAANFSYPQSVATARRFVAITSGNAFVCGLDVEQRVWCWGSNINGALGREPAVLGAASTPLEVIR